MLSLQGPISFKKDFSDMSSDILQSVTEAAIY